MPNYPTAYKPAAAKYAPPAGFQSLGELSLTKQGQPSGGYEYGETGAGYADWGNMPSGGGKSASAGPINPKLIGGTGMSAGLLRAAGALGTVYSSLTLGELSRASAKHAAAPALQLLQRTPGNVRFGVPSNWAQHCGPIYPGAPTSFKNYNGEDFWHASTTHAGTDASMSTLRTGTCPPASLNACYARDNTVAALTNFGFAIAHFVRTGAIGAVPWAFRQHVTAPTQEYDTITYRKSAEVLRTLSALAPVAAILTGLPKAKFMPKPQGHPDFDGGHFPPGYDGPGEGELEYGSTPPSKTKEKKSKARSPLGKALARRSTRAFGKLTEACDVVEALYDALPEGSQRRVWQKDSEGEWKAPGCKGKAAQVYKEFDSIDWDKATENLIENELEDQAIGRTARKTADNFRKAGWSFAGGVGFGPAL